MEQERKGAEARTTGLGGIVWDCTFPFRRTASLRWHTKGKEALHTEPPGKGYMDATCVN